MTNGNAANDRGAEEKGTDVIDSVAPVRANAPLILIGPPGAGCTSVAQALAQARGTTCYDVGTQVADGLGIDADTALVAVGEARYREAEVACVLRLVRGVGPGEVLALGSGSLDCVQVVDELECARRRGAIIVALTATTRALAHRNGLDAPRSVALGNVNHVFTHMLRVREARCRELASCVIDTTDYLPEQVAQALYPAA